MKPIIVAKNIGKKYNITHQKGGYVTLRDVLANISMNPFRFLTNKAREIAGINTKEEFWALRDLNFEIYPGEIVGVIGSNGAGKSTLLKILTGITPPTEGEITMHGRVSSLLEIGTGFHPELSGRENILLNGAILGMTRKEIIKKFDEIVNFAGIEKFLDTPVKYYSSGMYVRLAFSVAAHLEPDILLVDEVLAVGDAAFQKKSLGKMSDVVQKSGRTILFVSHSMTAITSLCKRCILLERGQIKMIGPTKDVVSYYLTSGETKNGNKQDAKIDFAPNKNKIMQISRVSIANQSNIPTSEIPIGEPFTLELEYDVRQEVHDVYITLILSTPESPRFMDILESDCVNDSLGPKVPGHYKARIEFPGILNAKRYQTMIVFESGQQTLDKQETIKFDIIDKKIRAYGFQGRANIIPPLKWQTSKNS